MERMVLESESSSPTEASETDFVPELPPFPKEVGEEEIGGRLRDYVENWECIGADPWVIQTIASGYKWEFIEEPPLTSSPNVISVASSWKKEIGMDQQIQKLLQMNAVEVVTREETPGFYNRFFVVPKKETDQWRAILDLSQLNQYIVKEKFKMETAEMVREHVKEGEYMVSLDLKDAYRHIMIHPAYRKYLRFVYKGVIYQYRSLPMGISTAPRVFNRVVKWIKGYFQRRGTKVHQYLDDWLLHAGSRQLVHLQAQQVMEVTQKLGFVINLEKSELEPTQDCVHLAYRFRLDHGLVMPTEERWKKIQGKILHMITAETVTAREWQSVLGLLTATEKVVHLGMLHVRDIQKAMLDQWSPFRGDPVEQLIVTDKAKEQLRWWRNRDNVMAGVPLQAFQPTCQIFTDASLIGWGGHLEDMCIKGRWSDQEKTYHINVLELIAVHRVLEGFVHQLQGQTIMVATDNATTVAYIRNQGGTRSASMLGVTQILYQWLEKHRIHIRCRHVPGRLNIIADGLSRETQVANTEWSIHPEVLKTLWQVWDKPLVDMFATKDNCKMSLYVSPIPDSQAVGVDALAMDWKGQHMYMYPPTAILAKVLEKMLSQECSAVLIAPAWSQQRWYPSLLEMLMDHPVKLPEWPTLLKQPKTAIFHPRPEILHLHAWPLSSRATQIEAFQRRLQAEWPERRRRQVLTAMRESGDSSVLGVRRGIPILSKWM